jgi:hypothetical protein
MLASIEATRTRRVYCYDGLSPAAQESARAAIRQWIADDYNQDGLVEFLSAVLVSEFGTPVERESAVSRAVTVECSLSYCQGDGARIIGTLHRGDAPRLSWPAGADYVTISPIRGTHYVHESSFTVDYHRDDEDVYDVFAWSSPSHASRYALAVTGGDTTADECRTFDRQVRDVCRELSREGYRWIEDAEDALVAFHLSEHPEPYRWNEDGTLAPFEYWQGIPVAAVTA